MNRQQAIFSLVSGLVLILVDIYLVWSLNLPAQLLLLVGAGLFTAKLFALFVAITPLNRRNSGLNLAIGSAE